MTRPQRRQPGASETGGSGGQRTGARGQGPYTPGASGTRQAVERSSARPLLYLRQLPRWLPPLVMLALLIAGLALPGWIGATALVLVAAFLAWLCYISWPGVSAPGRLLRIAAVACMLVLAAVQAGR